MVMQYFPKGGVVGRLPMSNMPDGTLGQVLTAQGAGSDPIYAYGLYTLSLHLYEFDVNTLSLENLAGGTYKNLDLGIYTAHAHSANAVGAIFQSQKSRGTATVPVIVTTGDILREDRAYGYDGASYLFMGASYFFSTGTIAATRVPTRWEVWIATDVAPSVLTKSLMLSAAVTAFGMDALTVNTGVYNCAFGPWALKTNSTGNYNCAFGPCALYTNSTSAYNCAFGAYALYTNIVAYNSAFGAYALANNSAGSSNVALGYKAGYYETGSNALYIDNAPRANLADGKLKALIYGLFNATPANQLLTFNAMVKLGVGMILNSVSGVIGLSVVSTALTLGSLGSVILPQGNMSGAANDAARDALAGNVAGAIAWDAADLSLWARHTDGTWKHVHLA